MRTSTVKSLAAIALTGAGSALVIGFQPAPTLSQPAGSSSATSTPRTSSTTPRTATSTPRTSSTSPSAASATTPTSSAGATATTASATYTDGTYTGAAVSEPWGAFQVQVTIGGGRITAVNVVQSPQDHHSSRINSSAVPTLTQAALAAQSASIDLVSGATWTSNSYLTSLQAALDQAKAAATTTGAAG